MVHTGTIGRVFLLFTIMLIVLEINGVSYNLKITRFDCLEHDPVHVTKGECTRKAPNRTTILLTGIADLAPGFVFDKILVYE